MKRPIDLQRDPGDEEDQRKSPGGDLHTGTQEGALEKDMSEEASELKKAQIERGS